jgi:hypothetical protein
MAQNDRIAIFIVDKVSTMTCAYFFCVVALCGLVGIAHTLAAIVAWFSQCMIQLVMLSILALAGKIAQSTLEKILSLIRESLANQREILLHLESQGNQNALILAKLAEHNELLLSITQAIKCEDDAILSEEKVGIEDRLAIIADMLTQHIIDIGGTLKDGM